MTLDEAQARIAELEAQLPKHNCVSCGRPCDCHPHASTKQCYACVRCNKEQDSRDHREEVAELKSERDSARAEVVESARQLAAANIERDSLRLEVERLRDERRDALEQMGASHTESLVAVAKETRERDDKHVAQLMEARPRASV